MMSREPIRLEQQRPSISALVSAIGLAGLVLLVGLVAPFILAAGGPCSAVGTVCAVVGPTTVLLSMLLAHRITLRYLSSERRGIAGPLIGCGALAGMANGVLCAVVVSAISAGSDAGRLLIACVIGGAILGAPLGALFSLIYLPPLWRFRHCQHAWDGVDRFRTTLGLWLFTVTSACLLLLLGGQALGDRRPAEVGPVLLPLLLLALVGGALALRSALRRWHRALWLRRVASGREPQWSISMSAGLLLSATDLPSLGKPPHVAVLVRRETSAEGAPYRERLTLTPVARISLCP